MRAAGHMLPTFILLGDPFHKKLIGGALASNLKEIALCLQIPIITLHLIMNTIGRTYVSI
jgi:hypothetical protein